MGALVFAAHIVQALEEVAFWYVFAGQLIHAASEKLDAAISYVPVGQSAHPVISATIDTLA